jgi:arylsulfatase A-like enzyme
MRKRHKRFLLILTVLLPLLCILLFAKKLKHPKRFENYNVILVFIDTLRADRLGCYGYFRNTSPNIDKLARTSAVFEENFSTATYTLPSFMSIITALYPSSHGVLKIFKDRLSGRVTTLAQVLKAYGYVTVWFGPCDDPHLDTAVGFGRGFEEIYSSGDVCGLMDYRENILGWIEKNKKEGFFLNFHTYKLHTPYMPGPEYKAKFTKIKGLSGVTENFDEYSAGSIRKVAGDKKLAIHFMGKKLYRQFISEGLLKGSDREVRDFFTARGQENKMLNIQDYVYWADIDLKDKTTNAYIQILYDADILEYDQEVIGPLIAKLKELGIYDKTMIVICSDHGEEFYEHGDHGHGATFYDEVTRVPLIVHVPWIKKGRRIRELTQTVDIMPTILDLLDIPVPGQAQGKSLKEFICGRHPLPPHEYVFGMMSTLSYIRSKDLLFVADNDSGRNGLFDLVLDPGEKNNLNFEKCDVAAKLEFELEAFRKSLPSYRDREYFFDPGIDKETQEKIRKTGYW